jgi:membrane-bound ClpP family serine protease
MSRFSPCSGIGYRTAAPTVTIAIKGAINDAMKRGVLSQLGAIGPKTNLLVKIDSPGGLVAPAKAIANSWRLPITALWRRNKPSNRLWR